MIASATLAHFGNAPFMRLARPLLLLNRPQPPAQAIYAELDGAKEKARAAREREMRPGRSEEEAAALAAARAVCDDMSAATRASAGPGDVRRAVRAVHTLLQVTLMFIVRS